jgi:hypothetical protein
MSESYVSEKLWSAADILANEERPLRDRLDDAAVSALIRLNPEDFDDLDDRAEFERIMARLTAFQAVADEGDVAASAQLLSPAEADEVASTIRRLHERYPFPD